jgi:hypothetical protein
MDVYSKITSSGGNVLNAFGKKKDECCLEFSPSEWTQVVARYKYENQ